MAATRVFVVVGMLAAASCRDFSGQIGRVWGASGLGAGGACAGASENEPKDGRTSSCSTHAAEGASGGDPSDQAGGPSTRAGDGGDANLGGDTCTVSSSGDTLGGAAGTDDAGSTSGSSGNHPGPAVGGSSATGGSLGGHGNTPTGSCDRSAPFILSLLPIASHLFQSLDSAWLSPDAKRLYVSGVLWTAETTDSDLYVLSRSDRSSEFAAPLALENVSTPFRDRMIRLTNDELWVVFGAESGEADFDIYLSQRASLADDFGTALPVAELAGEGRQLPGSFSADGRSLYFESHDDLYRADLDDAGMVIGLTALEEVSNDEVYDRHPVISSDGRTLYFSRDTAEARTDIFSAHRDSWEGPFIEQKSIPTLNTEAREFVNWIAEDECTLILGSDRSLGLRMYEFFLAERERR